MERITTNRSAYFNEIRKELLDTQPCNNRKPIFTYCEIGQLLTHGYSISLLICENSCLFIKEWNAGYDNERFELGIVNLDRLAVTDYEIELNNTDLSKINSLLKSHLNNIKQDVIILDGLHCEFKFGELTLQWNMEKEMNPALFELVCFIKSRTMV